MKSCRKTCLHPSAKLFPCDVKHSFVRPTVTGFWHGTLPQLAALIEQITLNGKTSALCVLPDSLSQLEAAVESIRAIILLCDRLQVTKRIVCQVSYALTETMAGKSCKVALFFIDWKSEDTQQLMSGTDWDLFIFSIYIFIYELFYKFLPRNSFQISLSQHIYLYKNSFHFNYRLLKIYLSLDISMRNYFYLSVNE